MSNRTQEWFDKMVRGLAKQDWKRATDIDGTCLYRTKDGKCCAVGQIIPDDAPVIRTNEGLLGMIYYGDENTRNLERLGLGPITDRQERDFLLDAQTAHDELGSTRSLDMRQNFKDLGTQYLLTWPTDVP